MIVKPYQVQAVAKLLGTSVDAVRRSVDEFDIKVGRRESGVQTRLFSLENVYELAARRAAKKSRKTGKKVIGTIYAPKGGVGKTTIAHNVASLFPMHGVKTLIVDLDFQSNLTLAFGYDSEITREEAAKENIPVEQIVEYHLGSLIPEWPLGTRPLDEVIKKPFGEYGPALIPADLTLDRLDTLLTFETLGGKNGDMKIGKMLSEARSGRNKLLDMSEYDVILFDAAPARNRMTLGALLASDFVITPVSMEKFSTKALSYLNTVLNDMQDERSRRPDQIILGNFFDANRVRVIATAMEITAAYRDAWLENTIRRSEVIPKLLSADGNRPVALAQPSDDAAADMRAVAEALLVRMGVLEANDK